MNRNMQLLIALCLCLFGTTVVFGQGINRNDIAPEATEIWEPVPEKVTVNDGVPSDAIVLFGGDNLDAWQSYGGEAAEWTVSDGIMTVKPGSGNIRTKETFGDMQLHIEWASPSVVSGDGQGRGNSGIFIMGKYEVQILDNYNNRTYSNGQASGIYKQTMPLVNACKAPGEWQTYDIIFRAPRFNDSGIKTHPATVTVLHNGVVTLDHTVIWGPTEYKGLPMDKAHRNEALGLQDHGNLVRFKNIWIRRL